MLTPVLLIVGFALLGYAAYEVLLRPIRPNLPWPQAAARPSTRDHHRPPGRPPRYPDQWPHRTRSAAPVAMPRSLPDLWALIMARPATAVLGVTTCLAVVFYSWGINSWRFSFIGDEWAFYSLAKDIAARNLLVNPLDANGVYSSNGVLCSLFQAIFIKLLGATNFAWRFSDTVLIVPLGILTFLWLRRLFGTSAALLATIILQSSFYLANFFKIGYNNPQAVVMLIASLYAATLCAERPTVKRLLALGIVLGISFYIYVGPIFPLIVWPFLLPMLSRRHRNRSTLVAILAGGVAYALLVLPVVQDLSHMGAATGKTVLHPEFSDRFQILVNIWNGFLIFYQPSAADHFVTNPCLDVITRLLALAGTVLVAVSLRRPAYLLFALSYVSAVVVIFGTSPYSYVPTTRSILFVPFGAAFAGLALDAILTPLKGRVHVRWIAVAAAPVLLAIFGLNLYQSQVGALQALPIDPTALIIRKLQHVQETGSGRRTLLLLSDGFGFNYQNVTVMQQAYQLDRAPFVVVISSRLRCADLAHSDVLVLDGDPTAHAALTALTCAGTTPLTVI